MLLQFETFKSGFEEERRGRIRAQDELEDLLSKKGVAKAHQKQIDKSRHSFKMELAMMEEKLKTESDTYKDVICHFKATVEKLVAEKEMYKKEQHAKGIDLMKLKKVIEKSEVKIEKSERKIASLTREIHALKEDKKFTSREIKMLKQRVKFYSFFSSTCNEMTLVGVSCYVLEIAGKLRGSVSSIHLGICTRYHALKITM